MYKATITEMFGDFDIKEKIKCKDTSGMESIDKVLDDIPMLLNIAKACILDIQNDKSKGDINYKNIVLVTTENEYYYTGSNSFINAILDLINELAENNLNFPYEIKVYRKPSKNFKDKTFITCTLA